MCGVTLARRNHPPVGCGQSGVITRWSAGRGVGDERRCEGARRKVGLAVAEGLPGLRRGLAGQCRPLPLSANITETPATLGISVGRWR